MSLRVLIVDDDPSILAVMDLILTLEGIEIETASGGHVGIIRALESVPDVIILDVMMPDLNGPSAARAIQADPTTAHIPLVFLSALPPPADIEAEWGVACAGFVRKPFDNDDIVRLLQRLAPLHYFSSSR